MENSSESKYNLIFKGELVKSVDLETAKKNISQLFKVNGPKLDALFSGKSVTLKKGLDFETANKYRVAIKKAGARVDLVEQDSTPKQAPTTQSTKAIFKVDDSPVQSQASEKSSPAFETESPTIESTPLSPQSDSLNPTTVNTVESVIAQQVDFNTQESIDLSPLGASLSDEKSEDSLPVIDVSDISLREMEGNLVDDEERPSLPLMDVNTAEFDMADLGEDILLPDEKQKSVELNLDLSAYSLDELGAQLEPTKPAPPPAPDVSRITLQENS